MNYYELLTDKQKEAVFCTAKAIRVVAGAGSGKTRVLITRIIYLLKELNILENEILGITFTNKAAREMKERLEKYLGFKSEVMISTIHSICARILRESIHFLNYPNSYIVLDSEDQKTILKNICKELDVDRKEINYYSISSYISNNKTHHINPNEALKFTYEDEGEKLKQKIYERYEMYLSNNFMLDFDDLILKTIKLFKEFPQVALKYAERYKYVLVDEFQDVDHNQYELIKLLSHKHQNVYVVGDPDQTIYSWRGASVDIILNFEKDFKDSKTIILNENFRSSGNILKGSNSIIKNNQNRIDKDLFTSKGEGEKIRVKGFLNEELEASFVAEEIKNKYQNSYKDVAVLYRANYQSRIIEKKLIENRIPYLIYGGIRFYERAEIKDVLAYLRMIVVGDDIALLRTINNPKRGIGDKSIEEFLLKASESKCSIYEYLISHKSELKNKKLINYLEVIEKLKSDIEIKSIEDLYSEVLEFTGYKQMLLDNREHERIENINELLKDIKSYQENYPEDNLLDYLQMVNLYSENFKEAKSDNTLLLMTVHSAKGLEFESVYIIGLNDGVFPSERSMTEKSGLEEERRLAYVAYTRAKNNLCLTYNTGINYSGKVGIPSRFINEIDEEFVLNHNKQTNQVTSGKNSNTRYKNGDKVHHKIFGDGVVVGVEGLNIKVAFKFPHGIKTISTSVPVISKIGD